jgi:hypothetical protein
MSGWPSSADPIPREDADGSATGSAPEPLFQPEWTPALLAAVCATRAPSGPLEVARLVDLAATAVPLTEIRRPRRTLAHGVQLLIDTGPGMMPYAQDCALLRRAVLAVVGTRVAVLRFAGCPTRGAGTGPRPWGRYRPPPAPTPVLLLTDLGIGRPEPPAERVGVREWLAFADLLRRQGCDGVALVPYPRRRVPAPLRAALHVVEWDRATTVRSVHRGPQR